MNNRAGKTQYLGAQLTARLLLPLVFLLRWRNMEGQNGKTGVGDGKYDKFSSHVLCSHNFQVAEGPFPGIH